MFSSRPHNRTQQHTLTGLEHPKATRRDRKHPTDLEIPRTDTHWSFRTLMPSMSGDRRKKKPRWSNLSRHVLQLLSNTSLIIRQGDTHGSKADPPRFKDHTKLLCARHSRSGRKKYVKKHPERVRKVPSRKVGRTFVVGMQLNSTSSRVKGVPRVSVTRPTLTRTRSELLVSGSFLHRLLTQIWILRQLSAFA